MSDPRSPSREDAVTIVRRVAELRRLLEPVRREGRTVGLVPTMGALHEGHLALIRTASAESDVVVVSVFVNPAQFDDASDLQRYPRAEEQDVELAAASGARIVFAPDVGEVYPDGFSTGIHVGGVTERWEGASRGATHFDGVAVVVAKLFGMAEPDTAYFGRKDAQQVAVVRRLVTDLNLDVRVRTVPTVRDADGLALSSRNVRLSPQDRAIALSLSASLRRARARAAEGERSARRIAEEARRLLLDAGAQVEYWALVDPVSFEPVDVLPEGETLAIVAARVGGVRLIDNEPVVVDGS